MQMHTITSAAAAFRRGEFTPVDFLELCLARIDALEERIRAWVFVDKERSRADAVRLTGELKRGLDRGPLHGIPLGIKDLFDVFDWPTAAGSKLWANSYARQDCQAVTQLRQAGAVLVGKTVTTAYASFDPPVTQNPWRADRTPGGSSSGSAAAVACGMIPAAIGSQTGGSITRPASYCGVYGLKPTFGRVSLEGVVPLSTSLDHAGPIAGNVRDCALVLQAIARQNLAEPVDDFVAGIGSVSSRRLVAPSGYFFDRAEPVMRAGFERLLKRLQTLGWTIESRPLPTSFADVPGNHRTIMAVDAATFHGERWRRHPEDYPPKFTGLVEQGLATSAPDYSRCREHQHLAKIETTNWVGVNGPIIVPATTGPAPDPTTIGEPSFQGPWSYLGVPTVSLPYAWTEDGLPMCVQVVGGHWCEAELIAVAAELEAAIAFERREVLA